VPPYWQLDCPTPNLYPQMGGHHLLIRDAAAVTKTVSGGPGTPATVTIATPGSGTFIVPDGVTSLIRELWGAGASGGSSENGLGVPGAGGGGAGGYTTDTITVTPGQSIAYVVGTGGAAITTIFTDGHPGGDTTCGALTAGGGKAVNTGTDGSGNGIGGIGGTGTIAGGNGTAGAIPAGGHGGSAHNGGTGGAGGPSQNTPGSAGAAPGAGGGGAGQHFATSGAGANGQIAFTYSVASSVVVPVYDGSQQCVWRNSLIIDSQTQYHWYLYFGGAPVGEGSTPVGWYLVADCRSFQTPNDIGWYWLNLRAQPPAANWSSGADLDGWNCLGPNTLTSGSPPDNTELPSFPTQITLRPFWP
jgi:hypothetical protein